MIDWRPFDRLPTVGHDPRKRSIFDRLETALSRHWVTSWGWLLLLGLGIAAPVVGFAILRGGM